MLKEAIAVVQLNDNFKLDGNTTLSELTNFFDSYNSKISSISIGECLIVVAWGKESSALVSAVVQPLMVDDEGGGEHRP